MPLWSHDQQISVEHVQNLKEYSLFLALDYFKKVKRWTTQQQILLL